jgi:hypothetical protein
VPCRVPEISFRLSHHLPFSVSGNVGDKDKRCGDAAQPAPALFIQWKIK